MECVVKIPIWGEVDVKIRRVRNGVGQSHDEHVKYEVINVADFDIHCTK